MKIKILLIGMLIIMSVQLFAQETKGPKIGKDKYLHVIASFLATEASYVAMRSSGANLNDSRVGSLMFGVSVGIGKEYYDTKKKPPTGFSYKDLAADCIGVGLAMICVHSIQK